MKQSKIITLVCFITAVLISGCDKVTIIPERAPLPVQLRNDKPRTEIETGTIRGYFGDEYLIFNEHIEKVQPIDSFSNCYFYGACPEPFNQINLIRCNSSYLFSIFILGYPLDSLAANFPVVQKPGRFVEIQFSPLSGYNLDSPGNYHLFSSYGVNIVITDFSNDILSGTFGGTMYTSGGFPIGVSDGEFKLKIFRKYMKCGNGNRK